MRDVKKLSSVLHKALTDELLVWLPRDEGYDPSQRRNGLQNLLDLLKLLHRPDSQPNHGLVLKSLGLVDSAIGEAAEESQAAIALTGLLLDPEQRAGVSRILGSEVSFICGPHGTGRTLTAAASVFALNKRGETVLALAYTSSAADNLALAVQRAMANSGVLEAGKVVRIDSSEREAGAELDAVLPLAILAKRHPELFTKLREAQAG